MSPADLVFDARYVSFKDAVFGRNQSIEAAVSADRENLRSAQFRVSAAFAPVCSSMQNFVSVVVGGRVPAQVLKPVVGGVPIVVTTLMADGGRTTKREEDKSMNLHALRLIFPPKKYKESPLGLAVRCLLGPPGPVIAHITEVGNVVKTFKAENWFPCFHAWNYPTSGMVEQA